MLLLTDTRKSAIETKFFTNSSWNFVEHFWKSILNSSHPTARSWRNVWTNLKPLNETILSQWRVSFLSVLYAASLSNTGRSAVYELLRSKSAWNSDVCICPARLKGLLPKGSSIIKELRQVPKFMDLSSVETAFCWLKIVFDSSADLMNKQDDQKENFLKLLTFNVSGLPKPIGTLDVNPNRFYNIGKELKKISADIIALQEMWDSSCDLAIKASRYPYFVSEFNNSSNLSFLGKSGLALISKYPIKKFETLQFQSSSGLEKIVKKGALFSRIISPNGEIDIYNVHLASEPERLNRLFVSDSYCKQIRNNQLSELRDWIKQRSKPHIPVYVLGDFNFTEDDSLYQKATRFLGDDIFRVRYGFMHHEDDEIISNSIFGATFDPQKNNLAKSNFNQPERLDYIWSNQKTDSPILYSAQRVFTEKPLSDHYGVLATIQEGI